MYHSWVRVACSVRQMLCEVLIGSLTNVITYILLWFITECSGEAPKPVFFTSGIKCFTYRLKRAMASTHSFPGPFKLTFTPTQQKAFSMLLCLRCSSSFKSLHTCLIQLTLSVPRWPLLFLHFSALDPIFRPPWPQYNFYHNIHVSDHYLYLCVLFSPLCFPCPGRILGNIRQMNTWMSYHSITLKSMLPLPRWIQSVFNTEY